MNHAATLAVPTILTAIWGISINENGIQESNIGIPIFCVLSILLLFIWRFLAHYLDESICDGYSQIIDLERELHIPKRVSISKRIISDVSNDLANRKVKNQTLGSDICKLCDEQTKEFVQFLIKEKRTGYRGHDNLDKIALMGIYYLGGIIVSLVIVYPLFDAFNLMDKYWFFTLCFTLIFSWVFLYFFYSIENQLLQLFNFTGDYDEKFIQETYDKKKIFVPTVPDDC